MVVLRFFDSCAMGFEVVALPWRICVVAASPASERMWVAVPLRPDVARAAGVTGDVK